MAPFEFDVPEVGEVIGDGQQLNRPSDLTFVRIGTIARAVGCDKRTILKRLKKSGVTPYLPGRRLQMFRMTDLVEQRIAPFETLANAVARERRERAGNFDDDKKGGGE